MEDFDKTRIVKTELHETAWKPVDDSLKVSGEEATRAKGYKHPGSYMDLPGGQFILFQYDESPMVVRNGITDVELIECLIDRLGVFAIKDHPLHSPHTVEAVKRLEEAKMWLNKRQLDRQARGVRFTDKS